jgi:hypothetical protein
MTQYLDNPAGRLHALLLEVHAANRQNFGVSAWDAWARILVPEQPPTSGAVFVALAELLQLPGAVRDAVAALDTDEEEKAELVEDLDKIEVGLEHAANRSQQLGEVPRSFRTGTLYRISA